MNLPSLKDHTAVPNIIFDEWIFKISPEEFKVLMCICRKMVGATSQFACINSEEFKNYIGLSKRVIAKAIRSLISKKMIRETEHDNLDYFYEIQLEGGE